MRVLHINSVCGVGSTGKIALQLYHMLENEKNTCCIAYGRGIVPKGIKTMQIGSQLGIYMHGGISRLTDRQGFYSRYATKKLVREIEKFKPDIIHLHNLHGYYINLTVLFEYLCRYGKQVIWTLHDCWAFTGHCAYFDYIKCQKWKTICYKCEQRNNYPKSFLCDHSRENYIKKKELFTSLNKLIIVTPSEWLSGLVNQSFLRKYPIQVINNGIDLSIFNQSKTLFKQQYHLENKKIILGVASPWSERKGIKFFIMLANMISDDYRIVLVGKGAEKIYHEKIIGIKQTSSSQELSLIYNAAEVFFNPTLEDNYPTTNLEALACGIPVITFNVGGNPEMVDKNFVISNFDIKKVWNTILQEKYLEYQFPPSDFLSHNTCFSKYLQLYAELGDLQ